MRDRATEQRRLRATARDHVLIFQDRCLYCGNPDIRPLFQPSGRTRHLDHFIPVEIVARVREHYPLARVPNWLLPCCPLCNNIAGQYLFASFAHKFDFVQARANRQILWRLSDTLQRELGAVQLPEIVAEILKPIDRFNADDYIVLFPQRLENGFWDAGPTAERALRKCNGKTRQPAS